MIFTKSLSFESILFKQFSFDKKKFLYLSFLKAKEICIFLPIAIGMRNGFLGSLVIKSRDLKEIGYFFIYFSGWKKTSKLKNGNALTDFSQ